MIDTSVPMNLLCDTRRHPREDIVVACFSRVIDMENFDRVLDTLPPRGQSNVAHRLGILNIFNARRPDRLFSLDLREHDEHVMVNILAKLALVEEGVNFCCPGGAHPNDYMGINFCPPRDGCQCHFYRDEKKFRESSHNLAWGVPNTWDDPRFLPDPANYVKGNYKRSQNPKKNCVPTEGRLHVRYNSEDVNESLRKFLNKEYLLVGAKQKSHVDKFARHLSFRLQKLV